MNHNSLKIKYEYFNISKLVNALDIINRDFFILKTVHTTNKKGLYIIVNKTGKKFFLKAKLKDFVSENELIVYKNIKKYSHININKIEFLYETSKFIIIISEFIDGITMSNKIYHSLYEDHIEQIFVQLLNGLQHLHSMGIVHGDVKPSNIMIRPLYNDNDQESELSMESFIQRTKLNNTNFTAVLIDFDFSKYNDKDDNFNVNKSYGSVGFMPPEIHNGILNKKSDIWGLAMSFYFYVFSNQLSKYDIIETREYSDISFLNLDLLNTYDGKHKILVNFIKKMLNTDNKLRPSVSDILSVLSK
jgi:serine/threonine protein kinase